MFGAPSWRTIERKKRNLSKWYHNKKRWTFLIICTTYTSRLSWDFFFIFGNKRLNVTLKIFSLHSKIYIRTLLTLFHFAQNWVLSEFLLVNKNRTTFLYTIILFCSIGSAQLSKLEKFRKFPTFTQELWFGAFGNLSRILV